MNSKLTLSVFLIALLIFSKTIISQSCSKGCLICSSGGICKMCDTSNFHVLSGNNCVQIKDLDKCLTIDSTGKCIECDKDYYLDLTTQKCVALSNVYKVENCTSYSSNKNCQSCSPGFYIMNSICLGTGKPIENCEVQIDEKTCQTCVSGYVMLPDSTACIQPPSNEANCENFSYVNCESCISNYVLDRNKYIRDFKANLNAMSVVDNISSFSISKKKNFNKGLISACSPQEITNCLEFNGLNSCKICKDGYYITENFYCEPNPLPVILHCKIYESAIKCKECQDGYHISSSLCVEVTAIPGCKTYDGTASVNICIECESSYYFSSISVCTLRTKEIENCNIYNTTEDKCSVCNDGFQITDDGLLCLAYVANCAEYKPSTSSSTEHGCTKCETGFFSASDKQCVQGTIINCEEFELETDNCLTCKNGFYLESSIKCVEHETITSCEIYDLYEANNCTICNNKNQKFIRTNTCAIASTIPGCTKYSTETTCQECAEGYLLSGTICDALSSSMNCMIASDASTCTQCKPNYILYDGTCKIGISHILDQCEENNINNGLETLDTARCLACKESNIAWNFDHEYICLDNHWVTELSSDTFSNCAQLDITEDETICTRCNSGYFLEDNNCVTACDSVPIVFNYIEEEDNNYYVTKGSYCASDSFATEIENCEVYAYANNVGSGDVDGLPICVKCSSGYGKVVDPTSPNSTGMESASLLENLKWKFSSPVSYLPKVASCIDISDASAITVLLAESGKKYIDGCEYYKRIGVTSKYGCIRCETGKKGLIAYTSDGYFISSCVTANCNSTFVPGLQAQLNSYVSCYKCTNSSSIPYLFLKGGSTYSNIDGYKSYDLNAANADWDSVTNGGYNVSCYAKNGSDFSSITSFNLPTNCSIGAFNVESNTASAANANTTNLASNTNLAVFCLACDPGYKRTFGTTTSNVEIPYMVYKCTKIDNCSVSNWYNYCSQCNINHAFLYSDSTGIDYTQCVSYSKDTNCLATYGAITGACAICKKGYTFNYDNVCEPIKIPNCLDSQFEYKRLFKRVDFNTIFYEAPEGRGCQKCKNGFTPVLSNLPTEACISSTYLSNVDKLTLTNYISKCTNYYLDEDTLKCKRCSSGYVLSSNDNECFSASQLSNCATATSSTECEVCIEGYIPIAKKCKKTDIDNCEIYDTSSNLTEVTCSHCIPGYYIDSNKCYQGKIANCISFSSNGTDCSECSAGYILVNASNKGYCFKLPTDLNCDSFDETEFQNNKLTCNKCSSLSPFYISTNLESEIINKCLPINEIFGCEEYDNSGSLSFSSLKCSLCATNFYLVDGSCLQRANIDLNCAEYVLDEDRCSTCKDSFYVSGNICVPNPTGIINCRTYNNAITCSGCEVNYYLSNNECISVSTENLIADCLYYNSETTCYKCKNSYVLESNKCNKASAQDCLTYKSTTECETCESNRGLKTDNGVTNCVINSDTNCKKFIPVYPFVCTVCKAGYYVNSEGVCTKVSQEVSNCETYSSSTTCVKCKIGYALDSTTNTCTNSSTYKQYISSTCDKSLLESKPVCSQCTDGYIFDDSGKCVKSCGEGCYYCDIDDTSNCLVCSTNYYMQEINKCVATSAIEDGSSSISLKSYFGALFTLLVFLLIA